MSTRKGFDANKDYYAALGVDHAVDHVDLKRVFFRLAKELHPDKTSGDFQKAERFKLVREAYEVLVDPDLRQQYNEARPFASNNTQQTPSTPPPTPGNEPRANPKPESPPPKPEPPPRKKSTPPKKSPAADYMFSDYYYSNYREKAYVLPAFRQAFEDAYGAWKSADDDVKELKHLTQMHPEFSELIREWEERRQEAEGLRVEKVRAETILKQHKTRARELWKRRKEADARVKRADVARRWTDRQKREIARQNAG